MPAWRNVLPWTAAAAVLFGLYARFAGLGIAPFSVDEYYLSQSIGNVLQHGIPSFDCGGLYVRGVAIQYLAAALQFLGMSAELAPRLLAAASSLVALLGAFVLGRRVFGPVIALIVLALLAVSVWEIEMARFGRMYAPFQAVFLWYMVFFLRYVVDRDVRALWPMLLLSILGPFVWEGGVFLLLANLVPVFLWLPSRGVVARDGFYLAGCLVLLALAYLFVTFDFRTSATDFPPGFSAPDAQPLPDPLTGMSSPYSRLLASPAGLFVALLPVALILWALRAIWALRSRPLLAAGLMAALLAAGLHQFLLATSIGVLLLLFRYLRWSELASATLRPLVVGVLGLGAFWVAFGIATTDWSSTAIGGLPRGLAMLGYRFLDFPDLVGVVVRPWVRAIPVLGALLFLALVAAIYRMMKSEEGLTAERAMLTILVILLLASSLSKPPRQETRYVFDLYPLMLMFAVVMTARLVARFVAAPGAAGLATAAVAFGGFALSEDFQPQHLRHISEPTQTFRIGMNADMESHLVVRDDYRAVAAWLRTNAPATGAVVISGVHGLDHYYSGIGYFFVGLRDPNFEGWSCEGGTRERWANYPLLHSPEALAAAIKPGRTAYLAAFSYDTKQLLQSLGPLRPRVALSYDGLVILELRG